MTQRNVFVWATVVLGSLMSLWACTHGDNPAAPTALHGEHASAGGEGTRGVNTVGPSPHPVGPSARPVGPSPRPVGPGSGGGGTPPPSGPPPSPGATPTPSPTTEPCSASTLIFSGNIPWVYTNGAGGGGPQFSIPPTSCRISAVRVAVRFTSSHPLDQILLSGSLSFDLQRPGAGPIGSRTLLLPASQAGSATEVGSACGALRFADGAPSFSTATAPFDGTFRPAGSFDFPGSYGDYIGKNAGGVWYLATYFTSYVTNSRVTLECWTVEFDTTS